MRMRRVDPERTSHVHTSHIHINQPPSTSNPQQNPIHAHAQTTAFFPYLPKELGALRVDARPERLDVGLDLGRDVDAEEDLGLGYLWCGGGVGWDVEEDGR